MKKIFIIVSLLLAGSIFTFSAQKTDQQIVFKDKTGKVIRQIAVQDREYAEKGKKISQRMKAMRSNDNRFTVVQDKRCEVGEKDPYKMRLANNTTIALYDEGGKEVSRQILGGRVNVLRISENGKAIVLVDEGFEDVEFEKYYIPGQKNIASLKEDALLKTTYLKVVNDKLETIYSTASVKGGWATVMLSPNGEWVVLEEHQTGKSVAGKGWSYYLKVIHVLDGKNYSVEWDKDAVLEGVGNAGRLTLRKIIGSSKNKHKIKSYDGSFVEVQKQIYGEYIWEPGMTGFVQDGQVKEEE